MKRVIITVAALVPLTFLPTLRGEALDLDAPLPPDLHAVSPWIPFSVRLALDLTALQAYQAALQRFHAWLDNLGQRSLEGGDTR
jgi:hypothetical protein